MAFCQAVMAYNSQRVLSLIKPVMEDFKKRNAGVFKNIRR
ncbi:hypothetical protein LEP1GSC043_3411 [Leptospira weilii str. Ecochallenge]|uniref:Uncharacterized protein n=1 Tax=Leptospira weilii str. Ecochallenge TaxID=1049986 RepID=N1U8M5_9LEPT|nr:hypothetical protein LEP1GSC043_3411 [Leptospira weilii str. Ecochallenge]